MLFQNYGAILNRKKVKEIIKYPEIKLDLLTAEQIFEDNQLEILKDCEKILEDTEYQKIKK